MLFRSPKDRIVSTTTGVETDDVGLIEVNEVGETTREGVFSAGDVVKGSWNVVQTVKDAKHVAAAIDEYLTKKRAETN